MYYTESKITWKDEFSIKLNWWDGSTWVTCSNTGVNTDCINGYSGFIWAKIRYNTTPSLYDPKGTPFSPTANTKQTPIPNPIPLGVMLQ